MGMKDVGTLKELGVCVGDVVEYVSGSYSHALRIGEKYTCENSKDGLLVRSGDGGFNWVHSCVWIHRIISRASAKPKLWKDMTAEEKGALLLAAHEWKVIEAHCDKQGWVTIYPSWDSDLAYRIKPEPKVETVTRDIWMDRLGWLYEDITCHHPVRVTFKTVDGVIDVSTYKVEPR